MSKRVALTAEIIPGVDYVVVGWLEFTKTGRILEVQIFDSVGKFTAGPEEERVETRCVPCANDVCYNGVVSLDGGDCLCCKSNHGRNDLTTVEG